MIKFIKYLYNRESEEKAYQQFSINATDGIITKKDVGRGLKRLANRKAPDS